MSRQAPIHRNVATAHRDARRRGFTLVDVLVAVAVAAIVAAIAAPSFVDYVRRGRIVEAVTRLSDYRVRMEQYFLDNRRYDDGGGRCGIDATAMSPADAFAVACSADASSYAITATGLGTKAMQGFVYTIDHANTRKTPAVPEGWTTSDACWVVRRDGSCV